MFLFHSSVRSEIVSSGKEKHCGKKAALVGRAHPLVSYVLPTLSRLPRTSKQARGDVITSSPSKTNPTCGSRGSTRMDRADTSNASWRSSFVHFRRNPTRTRAQDRTSQSHQRRERNVERKEDGNGSVPCLSHSSIPRFDFPILARRLFHSVRFVRRFERTKHERRRSRESRTKTGPIEPRSNRTPTERRSGFGSVNRDRSKRNEFLDRFRRTKGKIRLGIFGSCFPGLR